MTQLVNKTIEIFRDQYDAEPSLIVLSPGRINIIGEHIDYNNGFVLPAAIDKYICIAISKNEESEKSHFFAIDMDDHYTLDHRQPLKPSGDVSWTNYLLGVINQIQERGKIVGSVKLAFSSTIPIGAGLSSSAALECGFAFALDQLFDLNFSKKEIALISQKAEHTFAGVNCGIMDQFSSVFGKKDKVFKLDCDTLEYEYYNADLGDNTLVLFDSCVKHSLLASGYNDVRKDVEKGLELIKSNFAEVKNWRDVTIEMLNQIRNQLGDSIYDKCTFVIEEIQRVGLAADALKIGEFEVLGKLLSQTHFGLSKQYGVSCEELDFLVNETLKLDGVLGARMMGGGFGGCSINLIRKDQAEKVAETIAKIYLEEFNINLKIYPVKISEGTLKYEINVNI
ncbi:galactokinase [Epilithonimonas sp. JDS]|uniref:galactokinase n=1 Tax=Epilithonimonas sp. JDS TaxID=2902797 RepID=UPI001E2F65FC|nr:galactokinase [Epilithonimonas sp. JDS]MCD9856809.1 galactokinase [Epilithonimonas sp. JDS]